MSYLTLTGEQIKTALNIAGVKFEERGRSVWVNCFYHSDQSPSSSIVVDNSDLNGLYKCFSCGKVTNVQTYIRDLTGQSIYQLLNMDTNYNNFQFVNNLPKDKKVKEVSSKGIFNIEGDFYTLKEGTDAYDYLVYKRKIGSHLIKEFNISYVKWLEINKEIIKQGDREVVKRSVFRNRITVPIYYNKELVNIDGRTFTGDTPKVLYPRNSLKTLFNIENCDRSKPLLLTEGMIDMLNTYEYVNTNCSCSLGNELNDLQIDQLNEFKTVIVLKDNNDAGYKMITNIDESFDGDLYVVDIAGSYSDVNDIIRDNNLNYLMMIYKERKHITEYLLDKYELF